MRLPSQPAGPSAMTRESKPMGLRLARMLGGGRRCASLAMMTGLLGGHAGAQAPAAAVYRLDPTHTSVHAEVLHMGTSTLRLRFDTIEANIRFDASTQQMALGVTVDTTRLSSGQTAFDGVLKGTQLFDVGRHTTAQFVANQARFEGGAVREVSGELSLKDRIVPVTLKAVRWRCGLNPLFRREVCGGDFEGTLRRSDFGMTLALPLVADEVRLLVQVEAIRDAAP
jgi:polyisoprenoid-binding protein YceI